MVARLRGLAAEKLVFFLTATVGATEAAEQQHTHARGDEHCEEGSERE
jgi:hypothetical protein